MANATDIVSMFQASSDFSDVFAKYGAYMVLLTTILSALIIIWFVISRRYPRVTFEIIDGKRKTVEYRRMYGDKVVEDNLINILLFGERLLGFKINEFDYYYYGDKDVRYLATRDGQGNLIPLKIKEATIEVGEIGMAKEIAIRYINAIESAKEDLNKQNPIILALISVLPITVLVIITGVMFYLILNDALPRIIDIYKAVSADSVEIARLNYDTAQTLHGIAGAIPPTHSANYSELPLQNGSIILPTR